MRRIGQDTVVLLLVAAALAVHLVGCRPEDPLPPASLPPSLPRSMKGYELYSWKSGTAWRFTLITGTNRLKAWGEITSPETIVEGDWIKITVEGVPALKAALGKLPPGTHVGWCGKRDLSSGSPGLRERLRLPPRSMLKEVQSYCSERGIDLTVAR